jgi:hypothetical protein
LEKPQIAASMGAWRSAAHAGQRRCCCWHLRQPPGGQVVAGQLGQQVGRVHHHVLHHLAHAGLDLGHEHAQHKERGNAVDEKKANSRRMPRRMVYSKR